MNRIVTILVIVVTIGVGGYFGIPELTKMAGLQPDFHAPDLDAQGRRAVVISTSHSTLGEGDGKSTGVASLELTGPYYTFLSSDMDVDLASIDGGSIPIDPQTLNWPMVRSLDKRFQSDPVALAKAAYSIAIDDLDFTDYDIVYIAGGWGAAYDLAVSDRLGEGVSEAWIDGAVVATVCHGALGLLKAMDEDGRPLVEGRRVTGVTDKAIEELGITETPWHPERDLRGAGAIFEAQSGFNDIFTGIVVVDGRLVSGQNQNVSEETAYRAMQVMLDLPSD
ncbi:MAG: type 1 glutamine amidotransferase domain-containing protein [Pseudomonadota bacterium]